MLAPFREYGLATQLLEEVIHTAATKYRASSVVAHVWEANEEGLEWYRKRGFQEVGREESYYRRLNPQGAVVVQKKVSILDLLK